MSRRKVFIFGDSHTVALDKALRKRSSHGLSTSPVEFVMGRFSRFKAGETTEGVSWDAALQMLAEAAPQDVLISTLGGNVYSAVGLLEHPQPFDVLPADAALAIPGARVIPYRQMEANFDYRLGKWAGELANLRAAFAGPMHQLETPRPKGDAAFVLAHAQRNIPATIEAPVIAAADLRLRLWTLQRESMRRTCDAAGVEMIAAPPETGDGNGFLSPVYYAEDPTHANPAYGEQVLQFLEKRFASPHINAPTVATTLIPATFP